MNTILLITKSIGALSSYFYITTLIVAIILICTKYGNIKVYGKRLPINTFTYCAMAFTMGQGVSLFFWGVEEPFYHIKHDNMGLLESLTTTLTEWSWAPWICYSIVALGLLGIVSKTHKSIENLYIFKSPLLNIFFITVLLICTIFGIGSSFAYAPTRISQFSSRLGMDIPAMLIIILIAGVAIFSYISGILKGIKWFSQGTTIINVIIFTTVLLSCTSLFEVLRNFLSVTVLSLIDSIPVFLGFNYSLESLQTWVWANLSDYFTWNLPVALFLARISMGRSIREIILGLAIIPSIWHCLWFSTFSTVASQIGEETTIGVLSSLYNWKFFVLISIFTMFFMVITSLDSMLSNLNMISDKVKGYWYIIPILGIAILNRYAFSDDVVWFQRQLVIIIGFISMPLIGYICIKGILNLLKSEVK